MSLHVFRFNELSPVEFMEACFWDGAAEGARFRGVLTSHWGKALEEVRLAVDITAIELQGTVRELRKISRGNSRMLGRWAARRLGEVLT